MQPIFEERGQVILGHLAKRFGRQFENTKLLRRVIGPISTSNDYPKYLIQYYFDNCVNLCGSCSVETMPSHGPHRKSFNLLQNYSLPVREKSFLKKGICYL